MLAHFLGLIFILLSMDILCGSDRIPINKTPQKTYYEKLAPTGARGLRQNITQFENKQSTIIVPNIPKTPQNATELTEKRLRCFVAQLKSFIGETHLDTFRFEVMMQRLNEDLKCIIIQAKQANRDNTRLSQQLSVARQMFVSISSATQVLNFYDNISSAEHYLLNRMVDLNVRLWLLIDDHGDLNTRDVGCIQKLREFWKSMEFWKQSFLYLKDVPDSVHSIFMDQLLSAETTIEGLWDQVPRSGGLMAKA